VTAFCVCVIESACVCMHAHDLARECMCERESESVHEIERQTYLFWFNNKAVRVGCIGADLFGYVCIFVLVFVYISTCEST